MQPTSNAREEDVVVTIHAKNIDDAKTGLDRITTQIKKRTLGLAKFKDVEYKNYTIQYLGFSGFLKLFFGKLFSSIERPYFTYIDDCVVFSNSPSCLMDVIDDYLRGKTLAKNENFTAFMKNFDEEYNVNVFVQMPKVYSHLYYYAKGEKRLDIKDNKDIILSFTRVGFQLTSDGDKYKTTFMADFDEDAAFNAELEDIEAAAEELFVFEIDTGAFRIKPDDIEGLPDGPTKIFYEDDSAKVKFEGRIVDGKPDGLWRIYYESGNVAGAVDYKEGKAEGVAMYYFDIEEQKTLAEVEFEEDKIVGTYREFYKNGERKATVNYNEGLPEGDAEFFYDSGVTKIEGAYKEGRKVGQWKHYTETGELIDKEKWKKKQKQKKEREED
jgi:antitoxin component YwqK of YwqJK toxin-antitoxin module